VVNCTDIIDACEVAISTGPLVPAIMASIAYPGIFTTRKINDKVFVDGGVINPLPFQLLKGMDYLILVDVSVQKIKIDTNSNFKDVLFQSLAIMQGNIVRTNLKELKSPFVLIEPQVYERNEFDFKNVSDAIKEGEKAAESIIGRIKDDIAKLETGNNISTQYL
jgi:NTE family protein